MPPELNPQQKQVRGVLRIVGPAVLAVGLLFLVIGMGSFFSSFGSPGMPRYFWCAFVGMPLTFLGVAISKFAFLGAVTRYSAGEVAPVGKDVANYMIDGTQESVRELASAVGEGFRGEGPAGATHVVRCHKCNTDNDTEASFCDACGAALAKSQACTACGELNDPDARFCDHCGQAVA